MKVLGQPEEVWVALSAISTALTTAVVVAYTIYTRRMMQLAEESRRADTKVILIFQGLRFGEEHPAMFDVFVRVKNIGRGPAVAINAWAERPSKPYSLTGRVIHRTMFNYAFGCSEGAQYILPNEELDVRFFLFAPHKAWTFIVEAVDIHGGSHQLQVLSRNLDRNSLEVKMASALAPSVQDQLISSVDRFLSCLKEIEKRLNAFRLD